MATKKPKPIILRIPAEKFDAMLVAGEHMSNICFNLAQRDSIDATVRRSMRECQIEWDRVKREVRNG